MISKNFNKYCSQSDRILSRKDSDYVRHSISFLHCIKNHPEFIEKLTQKNFVALAKIFYSFIISLGSLFRLRGLSKIRKINKSFSIIIVSNLIKVGDLTQKKDFYFGNLQNIIDKSNKFCFKILINHTKFHSNDLNNILKTKKINNVFVLPRHLDLRLEIKLLFLAIKQLISLIILMLKPNSQLSKSFIIKSMISLFDKQTRFNLRIRLQYADIIKIINPKKVICPYEGFGYERMIFYESRKYSKHLKCFGYQHAPVTPINFSVKRKIRSSFIPDEVFFTNKTFMRELSSSKFNKKIKKRLIGNLRHPEIKIKKKKRLKLRCLILPEGYKSETNILLNFSIEAAKKSKNIKFIFRPNPYFKIKKNIKFPKNFSFSYSKPLRKDLGDTDFVLYRGSGASIQSVLNGNVPIYLALPNEKSIDPLIKHNLKSHTVSNKDEFIKLINHYFKKKYLYKKFIKSKIREKYFYRLNKKNIINYLVKT